ncbi:LOW QUALITY PROTEIN: beta-microseminoprotein-like [Dromiciops gliroides]|uniref:LOW QUALITY PROTEIN: beta-microseminoprotein-like n=1 Tax=Dromiciops gliroides TaxID=33562 RepID=UPI001CC5A1E7|nr:LOW QUALITY PROTEIN: beta-microseminoprotein-like [Dromiciops gliroides]
MKYFLGFFLSCILFVSWCQAQCYIVDTESTSEAVRKTRRKNPLFGTWTEWHRGCKALDGIMHPFRSEWMTKNCYKCQCNEDGIQCCNVAIKPINTDEENCLTFLNRATCTYQIMNKEDPTKTVGPILGLGNLNPS